MTAENDDRYLIERFLETLAAERDAAINTLMAYERDLLDFFAHINVKSTAVTAEHIRHYLEELECEGRSGSTVARRVSALRQYFLFLFGEGLKPDNPAAHLESPRRARMLPRVLSEADIDALLKTAQKKADATPNMANLRCLALIETLYATGLRVSELIMLKRHAMQNDQPILYIRGKGGHERLIPLGKRAKEALHLYLAAIDREKPQYKNNPWLFPSHGASGHLTRMRIQQILKDLAREAGVSPSLLSAHKFRHAFATHLLTHGADLRSVQKMLGHADISTTQIYTHILEERLQKLVKEKHPLARRGNPSDPETSA